MQLDVWHTALTRICLTWRVSQRDQGSQGEARCDVVENICPNTKKQRDGEIYTTSASLVHFLISLSVSAWSIFLYPVVSCSEFLFIYLFILLCITYIYYIIILLKYYIHYIYINISYTRCILDEDPHSTGLSVWCHDKGHADQFKEEILCLVSLPAPPAPAARARTPPVRLWCHTPGTRSARKSRCCIQTWPTTD